MHLAAVIPEATGHLNPSLALGRELARRGHRVSVLAAPRIRQKVESAGLGFIATGEAEDADGRAVAAFERLGRLRGASALFYTGRLICRWSAVLLRDLPKAIDGAEIDGLIVDQVCPAGAVVAERLGLPYVVACNALAFYHDRESPPPATAWRYRRGFGSRVRNELVRIFVPPVFDFLSGTRRCGVSPMMLGLESHHGLAVVAQQPKFFDFPHSSLPNHFHYTGPWHDLARDDDVPFPWERLDERPLVYASLGTVQNRLHRLYEAIAQAARGFDAQFVIALGRSTATLDFEPPENAIVVPYAPQLRLLERAAAAITHAGLNTALECLSRGVPMLCVPITNDQPGVARRVEWVGAGEVLPVGRVTPDRLRSQLTQILDDPDYAAKARHCREQIAKADGLRRAADVIEQAFSSGQRVPSGWNAHAQPVVAVTNQ
ncbi:MAG: glycosyltransferase [Planctomycetaceae bacterium]